MNVHCQDLKVQLSHSSVAFFVLLLCQLCVKLVIYEKALTLQEDVFRR